MIPRRIDRHTHVLGAPKEWDEGTNGKCVRLYVRRIEGDVWQSAWEPTPDELRALNEGASLILSVVGGQPAVALEVAADVTGADA